MSSDPRSTDSADDSPPTWEDNWILLRRLFPKWEPTEEQAREIWFRSFDQEHGLRGARKINQTALRTAIIEHHRSTRFPEPRFLDVSDLYRRERTGTLVALDRLRYRADQDGDREIVQREADRRLETIAGWETERLEAARDEVAKAVPTFRDKSLNPSAWSPVFTGLLLAADQRLQGRET